MQEQRGDACIGRRKKMWYGVRLGDIEGVEIEAIDVIN
jgi:hypothetical protein